MRDIKKKKMKKAQWVEHQADLKTAAKTVRTMSNQLYINGGMMCFGNRDYAKVASS